MITRMILFPRFVQLDCAECLMTVLCEHRFDFLVTVLKFIQNLNLQQDPRMSFLITYDTPLSANLNFNSKVACEFSLYWNEVRDYVTRCAVSLRFGRMT